MQAAIALNITTASIIETEEFNISRGNSRYMEMAWLCQLYKTSLPAKYYKS